MGDLPPLRFNPPYSKEGCLMVAKLKNRKIIEILGIHGELTGGQIKAYLDEQLKWGGGSINCVVMLCRRHPMVMKKELADRKGNNSRQIVWGLKG